MSGALTHSPSSIIQQLLVDLGIGTLPTAGGDWPIGATQERDKPDATITLYDTAGVFQGRIMIDGVMVERYGVQARVRSTTHNSGYTKASEIQDALDSSIQYSPTTIDGSTYIVYSVDRTSSIIAIGKPDSKRSLFTINAVVTLRQTT